MKNNLLSLFLISFLIFSCSSPRSTVSYGKHETTSAKTLTSIPSDPILFETADYKLYFSGNDILHVLADGERSILSRQSQEFIKENLPPDSQPKIKIERHVLIMNDTIPVNYPHSYNIEYAMDRLITQGKVFISRNNTIVVKVKHRKWTPRLQGSIVSKWMTKNDELIFEFIEGFVD